MFGTVVFVSKRCIQKCRFIGLYFLFSNYRPLSISEMGLLSPKTSIVNKNNEISRFPFELSKSVFHEIYFFFYFDFMF